MGQFWTKINDNAERDGRTATPWQTELPLRYRNLFFDLGGVIFNLNTQAAFRKFAEFGMPVPQEILDETKPLNGGRSSNPVLNLIHRHDTGELPGEAFLDIIQSQCRPEITRSQILEAFNGMIDVPENRLELLRCLHKTYKVFLVSNIGDIHWKVAQQMMQEKGYPVADLFDHCFCSFEMHVAKPDAEFFQKAIIESGVNPAETLYIDDSPVNIEAGKEAGLITHLIEPNTLEQHIPTIFH